MQPTIWNDERITAYVLGELSSEEASRLESELRTNAALAAAIEEATQITTNLSSLFAAEPPITLDSVMRQQILDAPIATESAIHSPAAVSTAALNTTSSTGRWSMMVLAATVLLIGTLGTLAYQSSQRDQAFVAMSAPQSKIATESAELSYPAGAAMAPMSVDNSNEDQEDQVVSGLLERTSPATTADMKQVQLRKEKSAKSIDKFATDELSTHAAGETIPGETAPMADAPMAAPMENLALNLPESAASASRFGMGSVDGDSLGAAKPMPTAASASDSAPVPEAMFNPRPSEPESSPQGVVEQEAQSMAVGSMLGGGVGAMPLERDSGFRARRKLADFAEQPIEEEALKREVPVGMMDAVILDAEGKGAGLGGDRYDPIIENDFRRVSEEPLSTFSIDVDTASYSKVRQFVMQAGSMPPAGAVRIEELVNYFDYQYEPPANDDEHPFVSRVEIAGCPWKPEHRLARIAIKGKEMKNDARPASNLVFLIDTSGSMEEPNKLPLVRQGLRKLVNELGERDRVAIVVYAGSAGLVLDSTIGTDRSTILRRINQMQAGGSTNGGEGIRLAYQVARDHFIKEGVNRVILCSDGDFNVGTTSDDELVTLVETEAKGGIDITVLGFGMGNHNDAMMEKISGRGNGNYAFIDTEAEAKRVLVDQTASTLVTIARDVKIQVEFNPTKVAAYRLIGYENRRLANEDFKDDTKDAGEIGAGHEVTAFYEWIPANADTAALAPELDELRYQQSLSPTEASKSEEALTVKLRYKKPGSDESTPISFPANDNEQSFDKASEDFRFAASVAGFGMLLRTSEYVGNWTLSDVELVASGAKGNDPHGLRNEFLEIVRRVSSYRTGEQPK